MLLQYKDLLWQQNRSRGEPNYQRALAKVRLGLEHPGGDTPSKQGTIEKPLLREESIDSTLKKSADKNLFGERRQDDQLFASSQKKDGFSAVRGLDDLGAQYPPNDMLDVSALFRAADYLAGPMNMSWRQVAPQSFLEQSMLMDELVPKYESLIIDRTHGKFWNTNEKMGGHQNTTGVTMIMNTTGNQTGRFTTDRKVRFDRDVLLSSKKDAPVQDESTMEWSHISLALGTAQKQFSEAWEDEEVQQLIQKVNSTQKSRNAPAEQHRGDHLGGHLQAGGTSFEQGLDFGGFNNDMGQLGEQFDPFRLSTVPENTLEDFATHGIGMPTYLNDPQDGWVLGEAYQESDVKQEIDLTHQVNPSSYPSGPDLLGR